MRVLVTGATGFLGRHAVSALLAAGHDVVAVARTGSNSATRESVSVDLLAPGAAAYIADRAKADALLHLAWTTDHGVYWNDLANIRWLAASLELVSAMIGNGTHRVCVAGTCFEYDWPQDDNCDELDTRVANHTLYDTTKDACRRVMSSLAEVNGLSFAWARLFHLYGSAEHPDRLVSSICRSLVRGQTALCSSGLALRDFMDVRDAGAALAAIAVSDVIGPVNVASGSITRVRDIAAVLGKLAGRSELIKVGGLPDRPNDPPRITANTQRLSREVGYVTEYPLERGLSDALAFWSERENDR